MARHGAQALRGAASILEESHRPVEKLAEKKTVIDINRSSQQKYMGFFIAGWWLVYPSEKYDFVNWDDEKFPIFLEK